MFGPDSSGIQPFRGFFFFQQVSKQHPRIILRQYRRARASKLKNRRARASKLKTTHMLRNSKRISQGRTLRPKPGSDAWDIVQGLVSARRRASLVPTPPLQKPAFRPNLPLPFLLTLSQGTILRQTLLGQRILGGFLGSQ